MEVAVTFSSPEDSFSQELWISQVPGAVGLLRAQTLPGGYLRLNPRFNNPGTIAKRCKAIGRPQRDCLLEWARLNPEKISLFLNRLAAEPKWPSQRKSNKKRPRASRRSNVAGIFTYGTTAALIRESFPSQKGVVVLETAPVAENLFDMSLDEILSDVEWEPTVVEILTPAVSIVVGDPVEDQE